MKDFLKYVLATVVGLMAFSIVVFLFGLIGLMGIIASQETTTSIPDQSVMVLNLSGTLNERAQANPLEQLQGGAPSAMGLDDMLAAIRKAKTADEVKGIYIEAGAFMPDSYASLQALRRALADFRSSGKWIIAYGDSYTQACYYVASVADQVLVNPQGVVDLHGLASKPMFVKDLLQKVGVAVQVVKVGAYKSATEMFTGEKMSDADRAQTTAYLTGIWQNVVKDIAASRHLTAQQVNAYADSAVMLMDASQYKKLRLVDDLCYTDEVKQIIKRKLGLDNDDAVKQVSVKAVVNAPTNQVEEGDEIAVYYAYGDIVDGVTGIANQKHVIDAQTVCKDLEDLMNDDAVKAVVLRVNSGGGSAYASEQICHQIQKLRAKKPVVVSMGGMAASGGYYISSFANWIVAEPTTLTGSIGIFGVVPEFSGLLQNKLGLKFDIVKTNKYSDFGDVSRPFSADEMHLLEGQIDRGYKLFRQRVATGRHLTIDQVEKVAQGHVWLGQDALKIKLVDQLGGLDAAVDKAAKLAKLPDYYTASYPASEGLFTQLFSRMTSNDTYLDEHLQAALGEYYQPLMLIRDVKSYNPLQARMPFFPNIQ